MCIILRDRSKRNSLKDLFETTLACKSDNVASICQWEEKERDPVILT